RVERLMQGEAGAGEAGGDDALAALNGAPGDGSGPSVGDGLGAGDGPGDSGGLSSALAARLAALGLAEGPSGASPGRGGGPGGANGRPARGGLEPTGDVHARSVVREGEQAVQVLEGLGRNAEAQQTYAELYPSYGAVAEEALASPRIPAARRETIRRYFEAIRPGAEATPAGVTDDRATEDRATDDRATDDRATEGRATREPAEGESR
ncbi:MAG: hypothetical protein KF901_34250, partial [Myxococcales bacterium]|nr:hypothetical protein [Myxococcales bacterium]